MANDENSKGRGNRKPRTIDLGTDEYAAKQPDQAAEAKPAAEDVVAAGEALFTPAEPAADAGSAPDAAQEPGAEHPEHVEPVAAMATEDRDALASVESGSTSELPPQQSQPAEPVAETEAAPAASDSETIVPDEPAKAPTEASPVPAAAPAPKRSVLGTFVAALAGGVVAVAILAGLGSAGIAIPGLTVSGTSAGQTAAGGADIEALRSEVASLKAQIAELPAQEAVAGDPALAGRIEALDGRLAATEQAAESLKNAIAALPAGSGEGASPELAARLEELTARLARTDASITELRSVAQAAPAGDPQAAQAAVDALEQKIAADLASLGERVASADAAAKPAAESGAGVEQRIAGLESAIGEIKALAEGLKEARETADTEGEMLARTVAANALRTAYDKGEGFAGLLASARTLTGESEALAVLDRHASAGVATDAALTEAFRAASDQALYALAPKEEGVVAQLMASARNLVKVKPAGPQPGDSPEAILSRVEAGIAAGKPDGALAEWNALPEAARNAAPSFGQMLSARVEADTAMHQVIEALAARNEG